MKRRVEVLKYEKKDKVAFVMLNGSDKMNALDREIVKELRNA